MNEIENVKGKRKPILYALSFLVLVICLLFTGIFTNTSMVVYATSYTNPRDTYLSRAFWNYYSMTDYYRDTDPNTSGYQGGNSNATLYDEHFEFTAGASLETSSLNYLTFRIKVTDMQILQNNEKLDTIWSLYKVNDGGGSSTHLVDLYQVTHTKDNNEYRSGHAVGIKPIYNSSSMERIGLSGYERNFEGKSDTDTWNAYWDNQMNGVWGGDMVSHYYWYDTPQSENWNKGCFRTTSDGYAYITLYTTDLYSKYYVTMKYDINDSNSTSLPMISTSCVSVYDILRTMYTKSNGINAFTELDESLRKQCNEIVGAPNMQEITISYLQQVGDTPFATRKQITTTAPIVNNILTLENVAKVINVSTIEFMQSYCDGFTYDKATDSYVAHYRESVCLRSKDADGHEVDYFLSPNRSYREFYYSFVENNVFGKDCYNYYWNSMIREYPEIWDIPDYELYGYFGYTVIPNKYTLNGLWDDLFDSRSFSGSISYFAYTDTLTQEQYDTLLGEQYDYSWLSRAWNGFMSLFDSYDGVPVSNYLFYVNDDGSDKLWIGENGADDFYDDNGAIVNDGEDLVEEIGKFFGNLFENFGTYIFGGLGIVLLIVIVLWIVRAFFKTKTAITESKQAKKRKKRKR